VVMTAVRLAWLQDAPANSHIVTVAYRPIREPGEIAPVKLLPMRFAVWEDLNIGRHGNGFLRQKVTKLRRSKIFIATAAYTRSAPLGAASKGTCSGLITLPVKISPLWG
jgi:predicted small integral membrane protein